MLSAILEIQIASTGYVGLVLCSTVVATASWSTSEGTMRFNATVTEATAHPVAAEYPNITLNGTQTCNSYSTVVLRYMKPT